MKSLRTHKLNPLKDGIDHINACSASKCLLGRMLSNFEEVDLDLPKLGKFKSMEGLWYWLITKNDGLRLLHGHEAKAFGSKLPKIGMNPGSQEFQEIMIMAMWMKIKSHKLLECELLKSNLPIVHYYVRKDGFGNEYGSPAKDYDWLWSSIEIFRDHLKAGSVPSNFSAMTRPELAASQFGLF